MPNTFFTSDTHFGHRNIIKYCERPFIDSSLPEDDKGRYMVWEMDEFLIDRWNSVVKPEDTVYHLGDFAYTGDFRHALECRMALNGTIHFVVGNHDEHALFMHEGLYPAAIWAPTRFASWDKMPEITVEGQTIVLCHYSLREWHHALRGVWHLYGHTHASLAPFGKSCDVGVDNAGVIAPGYEFCPLSFDQIKAYMDTLEIGPHPKFEHYRPGHPELEKTSIL